jgi:hypothetical protein
MKKIHGGMIMVAAMAILVSSAQAAITIRVAEEMQGSRAFIKGNGCGKGRTDHLGRCIGGHSQ